MEEELEVLEAILGDALHVEKEALKLTIKVKGQQVGDLKEYLARKKLERAAKGKSVVKSASQPGILDLWRTQRERFGEESNLANTDRETVSAAKGK